MNKILRAPLSRRERQIATNIRDELWRTCQPIVGPSSGESEDDTVPHRYTLEDVLPVLEGSLPFDFLDEAERKTGWDRGEDASLTAYTLLGHLQNWIVDRRMPWHRDTVREAFAAVERLAENPDEELLNALTVGLLEGHWPRSQIKLMGPHTRELYRYISFPPEERFGRPE